MKHPDEAIDRVMKGLREAKMPEGMELRVLARLQEQQAEPSRIRGVRPWLWSLGVASVVAASLIAVWVHHSGSHSGSGGNAVKIQQASARPEMMSPKGTDKPVAVLPAPQAAARTGRKAAVSQAAAAASSEDALAMSEMLAPSQPAPPEPLTEQERLLLLAIHSHDPVELAMLEREKSAAEFEREKAEVKSFFEPSAGSPGEKE